jgi:CubicO group peptidase (beta-lactamase class C family)
MGNRARATLAAAAAALATLAATPGAARAAPAGVSAAQHALDARRSTEGVASYALAMAPADGPIWTGSAGELRADARVPLGSGSGLLTRLAVVRAAHEGALQLSDPVVQHLPDVDLPGVTVAHLLDDTTGLPPRAGDRLHIAAPDSLEALTSLALERIPRGTPGGDAHRPSAVHDLLAGRVLAAALGRPFPEALDAALLRPLALRSTGLATPPLAPTHRVLLGAPLAAPVAAAPATPALGLASTARDLGRLAQHLLAGRSALSKSVLDHDGGASHLGWTPLDLGGVPGLAYTGDGPTSSIDLVLVPREEMAMVVLSDTGGVWPSLTVPRPGEQAARWVLGQAPPAPDGNAGRSRAVGAGLLAGAVGAMGAMLVARRRTGGRPRLAAAVTLVPAAGLTGLLALLTAENPAGFDAWRLLAHQQPDLAYGLAAVAALWALAAGAGLVRAARA